MSFFPPNPSNSSLQKADPKRLDIGQRLGLADDRHCGRRGCCLGGCDCVAHIGGGGVVVGGRGRDGGVARLETEKLGEINFFHFFDKKRGFLGAEKKRKEK